MRQQLMSLIQQEAANAKAGKASGIIIKVNSLEDREIIQELYQASDAGVPIRLIVRGICCLRPGRTALSENIMVRSIVGNYLEHSRIYYFHNNDDPLVYSGSADMMVRSFDRRLESLFQILDPVVKKEVMTILDFNLRDTVNSYRLLENGSYTKLKAPDRKSQFDVHKEFFNVSLEAIEHTDLFTDHLKPVIEAHLAKISAQAVEEDSQEASAEETLSSESK